MERITNSRVIENYPGFPEGVLGPKLMDLISLKTRSAAKLRRVNASRSLSHRPDRGKQVRRADFESHGKSMGRVRI